MRASGVCERGWERVREWERGGRKSKTSWEMFLIFVSCSNESHPMTIATHLHDLSLDYALSVFLSHTHTHTHTNSLSFSLAHNSALTYPSTCHTFDEQYHFIRKLWFLFSYSQRKKKQWFTLWKKSKNVICVWSMWPNRVKSKLTTFCKMNIPR